MNQPKLEPEAPLTEPRNPWLWVLVVYALFTLVLAYPALMGKFLVSPISDQYIGGFPVREFAASSLRSGAGFPEWNAYLLGGLPYLAAMHGDIFYPTFLLRMALPTDVAMSWSFIIHIFLAGVFTYGFLRASRLGFYPSLLGGAAYLLGGHISSSVSPGHDGKLYVAALFALTVWILLLAIRDGKRWAWGLLVLAVGLQILSPHPQLLQYSLLGSGAFALYVAFASHDGVVLPRPVAIRRLAMALGCVALGLGIGAIQYAPAMAYVGFSPRAGGRDLAFAASYSMPIEELLNTYLPEFSGILERYWGRTGIHFQSEYLGAAVLFLAGAGFIGAGRRSFRWFWTGVMIVALLWAFGDQTPFYQLVYHLVPGTKFFRAPNTIFFLVAFPVSVFAALGLERIIAKTVGIRYAMGWVIAALALAVFASIGGLTAIGGAIAGSERQAEMLANRGEMIFGAWRAFLFVALAAAVIVAYLRGKLGATMAAGAVILIVAIDLISVARRYWRFSEPAAVLYASDPIIEYIKAQPEPGRVVSLPISSEMAYHDPYLTGDAFMVHRVRQTLGYHGNELRRYQQLVGKDQGWGDAVQNPNVTALTNSRYLYTNGEVNQLTKLVGPVKNAAGTTVYLYQLPGDNPAAWVTSVSVSAPDEAALATVRDQRFDIRTAAIFDTSARIASAKTSLQSLPAPSAVKARVVRYETGHIVVDLDGPVEPGAALVVSENYYPGWRATVDGAPAAAGRADYTLIGVELPANAKRVDLTFHDAAYGRGKIITLLGLAVAAGLVLAGLVLEKRRA